MSGVYQQARAPVESKGCAGILFLTGAFDPPVSLRDLRLPVFSFFLRGVLISFARMSSAQRENPTVFTALERLNLLPTRMG